jgi:hypothetical protein
LRYVAIYDSIGDDGEPRLASDHLRLGPEEHVAIAAYLEAGTVVAATTQRVPDLLSGSSQPVVPLHVRTDGEWVWTAEVNYYVCRHALAPHEPFASYVRARGYRLPATVASDIVGAAFSFVVSAGEDNLE